MATPPRGPSAEAPDDQSRECPRCGAPYEPLQEYCLDCGARLPAGRGVAAETREAIARRFAWTPTAWFWPVLIGLMVAVLATGAVIALGGADDEDDAATLVATDAPTAGGNQAVEPTITPPEPTTQAPTQTAPTQTQPPPRRNRVISWPPGRNGYTVVLLNVPKSAAGRRNALEKARAALDAGLRQVGVLDSSRFSSLHPGYYVVFSGVYANPGAAQAARSNAESSGYPGAYVRQISR